MAASSDSDEECFVDLGKPLPVIEEEGKKKPLTLQDACSSSKDIRGQSRFHGAFTGGFSAGYFNTVGSKEGWAPSAFMSSRRNKQEVPSQQPENFMDEDDLGEYGIAPRQFATSDTFSSEERAQKRTAEAILSTRDSILPASAALADLIVPDRLSIGIKLLRKMGWKEGQGIGPRVKKKRLKKDEKHDAGVKVYGCSRLPASDEENEIEASDLDLSTVTFAPKDVTPVSLTSKNNVHGLGYHGLDPRSALPGSHVNLFELPAVKLSKHGRGIRGQAFGVGVLEDDDEDIYSVDSMTNYDQTMELDDSQQLFGWTAPGTASSRKGKSAQEQPKVPVSYVGNLLAGFTLSAKPLPVKKVFAAPELPAGFQPVHTFRKTAQQLAQQAVGEKAAATGQRSGHQKLNALERGSLLDERPVATSVFDLIPKDDMARLQAAKMAAGQVNGGGLLVSKENVDKHGEDAFMSMETEAGQTMTGRNEKPSLLLDKNAASLPAFPGSVALRPALPDSVALRPALPDSVALRPALPDSVALRPALPDSVALRPFHKDPAKQDRYDRYLTLLKRGIKDAYDAVASVAMTEWERDREGEEFSKAAKLYGPLPSMMASRFTRGIFIDSTDPPAVLATVEADKREETKAAEMKMYGTLTREDVEWHPHSLLCKCFNVPNPYPGSDVVGVPGLKRDKFSIFNFLSVSPVARQQASTTERSLNVKETANTLMQELNVSKKKKGALSIFSVLEDEADSARSLSSKPKAEDEDAADDAGSQWKAADDTENKEDEEPLDLFRAIFKNSDSESSTASDKSDDGGDHTGDDISDEEETEQARSKEHLSLAERLQDMNEQGHKLNTSPTRETTSAPTQSHRPRKRSRWGEGSIFDVLDQMPVKTPLLDQSQAAVSATLQERPLMAVISNTESQRLEEYGPVLPPPSSSSSSIIQSAGSFSPPVNQMETDSHNHHASKHRHKKEKKKSKHKKREKKKSKHSHSRDKRKHSTSTDDTNS